MVRHLETVVGLRTVEFAENFLSGHILRSIRQSTECVVITNIIIGDEIINFPQVDQQSEFPIGFFLRK